MSNSLLSSLISSRMFKTRRFSPSHSVSINKCASVSETLMRHHHGYSDTGKYFPLLITIPLQKFLHFSSILSQSAKVFRVYCDQIEPDVPLKSPSHGQWHFLVRPDGPLDQAGTIMGAKGPNRAEVGGDKTEQTEMDGVPNDHQTMKTNFRFSLHGRIVAKFTSFERE